MSVPAVEALAAVGRRLDRLVATLTAPATLAPATLPSATQALLADPLDLLAGVLPQDGAQAPGEPTDVPADVPDGGPAAGFAGPRRITPGRGRRVAGAAPAAADGALSVPGPWHRVEPAPDPFTDNTRVRGPATSRTDPSTRTEPGRTPFGPPPSGAQPVGPDHPGPEWASGGDPAGSHPAGIDPTPPRRATAGSAVHRAPAGSAVHRAPAGSAVHPAPAAAAGLPPPTGHGEAVLRVRRDPGTAAAVLRAQVVPAPAAGSPRPGRRDPLAAGRPVPAAIEPAALRGGAPADSSPVPPWAQHPTPTADPDPLTSAPLDELYAALADRLRLDVLRAYGTTEG